MANTRRILAGREDAWVEFRPDGYPFKLRRQLKAVVGDEEALVIIVPFISACSLPKMDGTTLTSISSLDDLLEVDEKVVIDIVWKFYDFRAERLSEPLAKNN